ncbi:Hypothetical protein, putative [Bodo saltans]|uniref:Uncharacterized protein n=1 Tax=Bodo saltans TaxID=75058 RepID=A0A0S4J8Z9_BODSA|nr:Hypothetical protein, putative [Bodo saltans]|eukprot:CUG84982.1 Hypothetical protein, putative [Bodo saltans]
MGATCSVVPEVASSREALNARSGGAGGGKELGSISGHGGGSESNSLRIARKMSNHDVHGIIAAGGTFDGQTPRHQQNTTTGTLSTNSRGTDRRFDLVGPVGQSGSYRQKHRSSVAATDSRSPDHFNQSAAAAAQQQQQHETPQQFNSTTAMHPPSSLTDAGTVTGLTTNNTGVDTPVSAIRERPRSTRTFPDLIANSLLLRYHPDRVAMFSRLRGGFVTPEGISIPTMQQRLAARAGEYETGLYEGAGHLYFLAPERPLPIPITAVPPVDMNAAVAGWAEHIRRGGMPEMEEAMREAQRNLGAHLAQTQVSVLQYVDGVRDGIAHMDFDVAIAACQQCMRIFSQNNMLRPLAVALQLLLTLNDILVIEHVGHTFEEAVRAYLHKAAAGTMPTTSSAGGASADEKPQEIPDLTTVLELYTLLNGGYHDANRNNTGAAPMNGGSSSRSVGPRVQSASRGHVPSLTSSFGAGGTGTRVSLQQISVMCNDEQNQQRQMQQQQQVSPQQPQGRVVAEAALSPQPPPFQPTLFAAFNASASETGIVVATMSHTRFNSSSITSAAGALRQSTSATGTAVSGGQLSTGSFLQLQEFHLPKIVGANGLGGVGGAEGDDNVQLELQLQLVEQVHFLLEVQQLLHDTLEYLVHVLHYHSGQLFPTVPVSPPPPLVHVVVQ